MGVGGLSAILLAFGVAGFVGSSLAGRLIERSMYLTLGLAPLAMSGLVAGLVLVGSAPLATTAFVALWGFAGATVPVGWQAWIARTVPDEAEVGGGLLVAAIQLAMSVGAAAGGLVFDASGPVVVFATSSAVMLVGASVIFTGLRTRATHFVRGAENAVEQGRAPGSGGNSRASFGSHIPASAGHSAA